MSLSLLTNVASLEAQRNVNSTQSLLSSSVQRLSSGLRINQASDDAAGLAITSALSAQIRGIAQAGRNANDAVSMLQSAEAGMGEINNLLSRMRELAVEAANGGTLSDSNRSALNTEFQALSSEIDRIVGVTAYNGQNLIDGSLSSGTSFQVGAFNSTNDEIAFSVGSSDVATLGLSSSDVLTTTDAQSALDALDTAISTVANQRAGLGATENRLQTTIDDLSQQYTTLSAANSRIADVDVAQETANFAQNQILLSAGISVLAQANQQPSVILKLLS